MLAAAGPSERNQPGVACGTAGAQADRVAALAAAVRCREAARGRGQLPAQLSARRHGAVDVDAGSIATQRALAADSSALQRLATRERAAAAAADFS